MKRILTVLAVVAAFTTVACAQVKSLSSASSALEKAKADTENPKKATKVQTWMKYGQALLSANDSPAGNGWIGASRQELQLLLNEKPLSAQWVELGGQKYVKEVYENHNYYYNSDAPEGRLMFIEVTKPILENALPLAVEAYSKAAELDVKGSKSKDIKTALQSINSKLVEKAYASYTLGNLAKASEEFEEAVTAAAASPLCQLDTNSLYNAGFTAWATGSMEKAKNCFRKCLDAGYYSADGEVFSKLADIASKEGNEDESAAYLEQGFQRFPQSQSILVGLINHYLTTNGNTDRLFELLDMAKQNEPGNASLYYVEGNICEKLGLTDKAIAAYDKCSEIDPSYAFGYIGKGILWYNLALKYQEEAQNEMNDAKYQILDAKFVEALKNCIPPFEKAMDLTSDDTTKVGIAEYLKNACFRFRTDDEFKAKYEKYNAIVAGK